MMPKICAYDDYMTATYVIRKLRSLCQINKRGQAGVADELKISQAYLCDVLAGRRSPGKKILDSLGIARLTTYKNLSDER